MTYTENQLKHSHEFSSRHKESVLSSSICGCFYCHKLFKPEEIKEWITYEGTALCPKCGIDSVLPDALVDKKTLEDPDFLMAMQILVYICKMIIYQ